MKLHKVKAAQIGSRVNSRHILIYEEPDGLYEGGQPADYTCGLLREDMARGFMKEDEAESVSSGFRRHQGVFQVGYATDFDFYHRSQESEFRKQKTENRKQKDKHWAVF
jgi:hypothetical protein